ncbi:MULTISPECIES: sensor histidine kinase [unclassified Luteococcus]|uniref:sensor histidine kinase n=1 Tax=unclassified Luteococcus TaxID=2639923 RepID=UPI00313D3CC5
MSRSPVFTVATRTSSGASSMREAVVQGLRFTGLLSWLVVTFVALVPTFDDVPMREFLPGLVLLGISNTLTLLGLLLDVRRPLLVRTAGFSLLGAGLLLAPERHLFSPANQWAPGFWALPMLAWALMVLHRCSYLRIAVVWAPLLTVVDVAIQLFNDQPITRLALSPAVWIAPPLLAVALFGDALLRLAERADHLTGQRREAQREQDQESLRRELTVENDRMMHDHVLHALHALGRGAGQVSPNLLVSECQTAVQAIGQDGDDPMLDLGRLLRSDPALAAAGGHVFGSAELAPRHVALAMQAATHEALDNVARHARATRCDVRLGQTDGRWVIRVRDDGIGFVPGQRPTGTGLQWAVSERMDRVGGAAEIDSQPGRGTQVTLTWPRAATAGEEALADTAREDVRRLLSLTAWPGLATGFLMTALMAPALSRPLLATWVCLGVLMAGFGAASWLRRHPLSRPAGLLLLLAAVAGWLVNLWLAPDALPSTDLLWMAWACSALLHLVVLQVPAGQGLMIALGWLGVQLGGALWRFGLHGPWSMLLPAVLTGSGQVFLVLVGLSVARRLARDHAFQASRTEQTRIATAQLQLAHHREQFWSRRATDEALPLLEDVASGRVRPDDPQVIQRAQRLTVELREDLLLGPEERELTAALASARDLGWTVTSTLKKESGRSLRHAVLLLEALGKPARQGQAVTVSARHGQAVAVVLDPTPEQQRRWATTMTGPRLGVDNDPEFSRLRVTSLAE